MALTTKFYNKGNSIYIPRQVHKELNIKDNAEEFEIVVMDEDTVILRRLKEVECSTCHTVSTEGDTITFKGLKICKNCLNEIQNHLNI